MRRTWTCRGELAATLGLLVALGAGGCGKGAQKSPDGGDGSLTTPDVPTTGRRSFDVVAVLSADGSTSVPPLDRFTLVQDLDTLRMIAGGNGRGTVLPVTSGDGRTFRSGGVFSVGDSTAAACSASEDVRYDSFEVTIADGSLTGTATGAASISCGDCSILIPFSATLTGTSDKTPPTLRAAGTPPSTPFDPIWLAASEPLPAGAAAKLVADDGTSIDLLPQITDGAVPLVLAFYKPDIVLPAGQGYVVTFDGLIDFAGLSDRVGPPLRVTSFLDAPTVPEDGFESATGASLGGAMVMTAGPLPAIAGHTSLYVGPGGAPGIDSPGGRSLMVRLARQPGDTKIRFSYRVVSAASQSSFVGTVRFGSEGASTGPSGFSIGDTTATPRETLTVAGQTAYATAVELMEQTLPADATDDVLVLIAPGSTVCRQGPVLNAGLLIDDLRLE